MSLRGIINNILFQTLFVLLTDYFLAKIIANFSEDLFNTNTIIQFLVPGAPPASTQIPNSHSTFRLPVVTIAS